MKEFELVGTYSCPHCKKNVLVYLGKGYSGQHSTPLIDPKEQKHWEHCQDLLEDIRAGKIQSDPRLGLVPLKVKYRRVIEAQLVRMDLLPCSEAIFFGPEPEMMEKDEDYGSLPYLIPGEIEERSHEADD